MSRLLLALGSILLISRGFSATFGTVTTVVGSVTDIVLDEARRRIYVVNGSQNRVEVYSQNPIRQTQSIQVGALPLSAAQSWDGGFLYVAAHNASALFVIDLNSLQVVGQVALPARPEGVAVGIDGRVLITTVGTGVNNSQNTLLLYDPEARNVVSVVVAPPTAAIPNVTPPAGRLFLSSRSRLEASSDGHFIMGINIPNNNSRAVFVYEVASGTVLRSRVINNTSGVLSVSPDGSRFMAGLTLVDARTLEVLAQQNLANASYPVPNGINFNLEQNQGGSVFSPDGSAVYGAFNVAPVQNPPARANIGQLMVSDPDNLLIHRAFQTPENLVGKMVITADGGTIYAISESGFATIAIGNVNSQPIAEVTSQVVLLASDQCGVSRSASASVPVVNAGGGRLTATAQVLQLPPAGPGGLGGVGGPGGGPPGGGIIIILPPVAPGGGGPPGGGGGGPLPGFPGAPGAAGNAAVLQTAPRIQTQPSAEGANVTVTYNTLNNRTIGTVTPVHDLLIQSPQAVNIPSRLRVYQNNRNAEATGDVIPVPVSVSANEGLVDIQMDSTRQLLYIANSGMNRVEVFDTRTKEFQTPIKVGQLPRSVAMTPDGSLLYVANSGSESISIVDLEERREIGRLRMPPLPFNANAALVTPSLVALTQRGPQVMMSDGRLWRAVGNELLPRVSVPAISSANAPVVPQPRTMAATPNGEYMILMAGNGFVYLYDSGVDDFVLGRQIFTNPIQGYYGPVGAGPGGRYFLANGTVLNSALTPIGSAGAVVVPQGANQQTLNRPISAVTPLSATQYVRFAQPIRAQANNPLANQPPTVEVADASNGNMMRAALGIEGPLATQTGNQRVNVIGRSMAVDARGTTAYMLTTSGLSIASLDVPPLNQRPQVAPRDGVVNSVNLQPSLAPGSMVAVRGARLAEQSSVQPGQALPTVMGGVCVTLNNQPLPLMSTAGEQIVAQIPPNLAAGRYPLVVRNVNAGVATNPVQVTVARYAPAVLVDPQTKQAAIYHSDGAPVTKDRPAKRDQRLRLFAVGLGATKGGTVIAGRPAPEDPPAITDPVSVFFGDPRWRQAAIAVEWSGLAPGMVGVYQVDLYVPGDHMRGEALDVTVRVGNVSSPTGGEFDPKIAVD
jgi:uncharacterized protein (TIGR03437 family)